MTPTAMAIQVFVSLIVGSAMFLLVYALFRYPVPSEPPIHRRIAASVGINRDTVFDNPALAPIMSLALSVAHRIGLPPLRDRIRDDLNAAGNPSGYSVDEYIALCLVMAVASGVAGISLQLFVSGPLLLVLVPSLVAIGFYLPLAGLRGEAQKRITRISKQLPYSLDLIALTMAAGSTFSEAVQALIRDNPSDDLNQELAVAMSEIEFGTTRSQALANIARRVPLETLRSVVGAVNQAESLGSPLSQILKLQSEMLRMQRSVRAEKLSASASLRILIPSMLILIAVVIVVFTPLVIQYVEQGSLF